MEVSMNEALLEQPVDMRSLTTSVMSIPEQGNEVISKEEARYLADYFLEKNRRAFEELAK
jgi:hypothetical protein